MVLLKGQDVLPLDESAVTDQAPVVLVGTPALHTTLMGGGSASLRPPHEISIAHGLTEALGRQPDPGGRRGGGPAEPAGRRARRRWSTRRPATPASGSSATTPTGREQASTTRRGRPGHPRHGVADRTTAPRTSSCRARLTAPTGSAGAGRRTRGRGVDADLRRPDVPGPSWPPPRRLGGGRLHGPAELVRPRSRPRRTDVLVARLTVPLGERFALAGLIAEAARTTTTTPSPRPRWRPGTPRRRSWWSG